MTQQMPDPIEPLILDFLEWVAKTPRPYTEVMDIWRTSCPRLAVWEEAVDRGLVRRAGPGASALIEATQSGRRLLRQEGRA